MSRLRAFMVEADADGRLVRKQDLERASSRREDSALQCVLYHRQSVDVSRVVNLAGRCLHAPKHSPTPLRLPQLFRHRPLGCVCVGASSYGADQSSPAKVCRQGFRSAQTSVYVARDTGVSGFSRPLSLPVSMPRSGCNFVGGFGCEVGRCSQC